MTSGCRERNITGLVYIQSLDTYICISAYASGDYFMMLSTVIVYDIMYICCHEISNK